MNDNAPKTKTASLRHERHFQRAGCQIIIGIDEAGRGPLAGPVAAAAVALPLTRPDLSQALKGVRDSKAMTSAQRECQADRIKDIALAWGIGHCSAAEIDRIGIVAATQKAMLAALDAALALGALQPDCLFLDHMLLPQRRDIPQVSLVKGDRHSLSIASASVLAKVWRDDQMRCIDAEFRQYGFAKHKGYGTADHLRALRVHGPCAIHRRSFKPVYSLINGDDA